MIQIETKRTTLQVLPSSCSERLLKYRVRNRERLAPWEPLRYSSYYTNNECRNALEANQLGFSQGKSICLWGIHNDTSDLVGSCNFTNIVRGPFQACFLGFSVDADYEGGGYMQEMLEPAITYVFEVTGLHRVMANYMPSNIRSAHLLKKLGFEQEGFARSYLKINGRWEDHVLTARVNPVHRT